MEYNYNITPNDPDELKGACRNFACVALIYILYALLSTTFGSCSLMRKVTEKVDTLQIIRSDTLKITEIKQEKLTEYIDRWRDNTYIINQSGDTTKHILKEYCYISFSKEQHDSIDRYRALCDSLKRVRQVEKYIEKPLNWWQKFKQDTYLYILISLLATLFVGCYRIFYHNKKP